MAKKKPPGQWWDRSWTLVEGCDWIEDGPMPPACDRCWARDMARRWNPDMLQFVALRHDRLELPLNVRHPLTWACQINYGDLFHGAVPDTFIAEAVNVMVGECRAEPAPLHTFVLLTKRPRRAARFFRGLAELPDNGMGTNQANALVLPGAPVYLVASAWDQASVDRACAELGRVGIKWGLHLEPLLGPVDLVRATGNTSFDPGGELGNDQPPLLPSWVAVGGENGQRARPMDLRWARNLRDQADAAGVPFWFKGPGRRGEDPPDLVIRQTPW